MSAVVPEKPRYVQADPFQAAVFGAVLRTAEARWCQEVREQLTPQWLSTPGAFAAHAAHTWGRSRACISGALPALVVSPPGPCLPLEHVVTVVLAQNGMIYRIT